MAINWLEDAAVVTSHIDRVRHLTPDDYNKFTIKWTLLIIGTEVSRSLGPPARRRLFIVPHTGALFTL